jgi:signal transduction histidine kinase
LWTNGGHLAVTKQLRGDKMWTISFKGYFCEMKLDFFPKVISEKKHTCLIMTIVFCLFFINNKTDCQVSRKGTVILNRDFISERIVDLSGEWKFCYGKFLSASEINELGNNQKQYVIIPLSWKQYTGYNHSLPAFGIATYYLKVVCTGCAGKKYQTLGIRTGNIICAYRLYVNNELLIQSGNPTQTAAGYVPMWGPKVCYFIPKSDTLQIILHVSNFLDPINAGIIQQIHLGTREDVELYIIKKNFVSVFILSSFILLFLFQLFLCFAHPGDSSHWIIALLVVCFFINVITNGEVLLMRLFPHFDAVLEYRLWLLSYICIPLSYKLVLVNFPSYSCKTLECWVLLFYSVVFLSVLIFDLSVVLNYLYLAVFPTIVFVIYLIIVLIRAVYDRKTYSVLFMVSFIVMLLLLLNDLIYMVDRLTFGYYSQFGVLLFTLTQSFITLLKYADSHQKALIVSEDLKISRVNLKLMVEAKTQELRKANEKYAVANRIQDFLLSSMSHDVIGSFNILLNYSKELMRVSNLTTEQSESALKIYRISENGYIMLEDLLGLARIRIVSDSVPFVIRNISEIIENNIQFYKDSINKKGIRIDVDINNHLCFLCDNGHLNIIVRRLLSNAIKYTYPNTCIYFSNVLDGGFVQIAIRDEGIGIPDDMMAILFEPEGAKIRQGTFGEQGSGLGLIIVKDLVIHNKGFIRCMNTKSGTTFIMQFPVFGTLENLE